MTIEIWQEFKHDETLTEVRVLPGTQSSNHQPFILLSDVQDVFPGATIIQNGKQPVSFMADLEGNRLMPLRVAHQPGLVLGVAFSDTVSSPLPHHNPQGVMLQVDDHKRQKRQDDIPVPHYPTFEDTPAPDYSPSPSSITAPSSTSSPTFPPKFSDAFTPILPEKKHYAQPATPEFRERAFDTEDVTPEQLQDMQVHLCRILSQNFALHELSIPRLFIVLPKDASDWDPDDLYDNKIQVYFLCDCGQHTQLCMNSTATTMTAASSVDSNQINQKATKMEHRLHLAPHKGYQLANSFAFLKKYGTQVLSLLQMFRYGIEVPGYEVPSTENLAKEEEIASSPALSEGIEVALYRAIELVQRVLQHGDGGFSRTDQGSNADDLLCFQNQDYELIPTYLKAGSDILATFENTTAGLYRIITVEENVKWVCHDHYAPFCRPTISDGLKGVITSFQGTYDERRGSLHVCLPSLPKEKYFYQELEKSQSIIELSLILAWSVTQKDLKDLVNRMEKNTRITSISLACSKFGSSFLSRNKRQDSVLQLLALPRLRVFGFGEMDGFLDRACAVPWFSQIRSLDLKGFTDWKQQGTRLPIFFRNCSKLMELKLNCQNIEFAFVAAQEAFETLDIIQQNQFRRLKLATAQGECVQVDYSRGRIVSMDVVAFLESFPQFTIAFGVIRRLGFAAQIDPVSENGRQTLEKIIRTQRHLEEVRITCLPKHFRPAYEFIRDLSLATREKSSPIQLLILSYCNNILTVNNLQDPASIALELKGYLSLEPKAVTTLLGEFGYALVNWEIHNNGMFTYPSTIIRGIYQPLRENYDQNGGGDLKLERLHITTGSLEPNDLHNISPMINVNCPRLNDFEIVFRDNFRIDIMVQFAWAEWFRTVSSKITSITIHTDIMRELRILERTCLMDFPGLRKFWILLPSPKALESKTFFHLWKQLEIFSAAPGINAALPRYSMSKSNTAQESLAITAPLSSQPPISSFNSTDSYDPSPTPTEAETAFRLWSGPKMSPELTSIGLENIHLAPIMWCKLLDVIDLFALEELSLKGSNITDMILKIIQCRLVKSESKSAEGSNNLNPSQSTNRTSTAASSDAMSQGDQVAKLKILNLQQCNNLSSTKKHELKPWVEKYLEGCTLIQ
ncbi:hypothetical protein BGX27_006609 [Mortierella sp. AM989]|nr:hypothetical protein BGX27_006609 [Mortierella sp. AM989]